MNDETQKPVLPAQQNEQPIDFDSDEPIYCNRDQSGDETCEACQ